MFLEPTGEFYDVPTSKITVANFASQTWEVPIPQTHPIDYIDIICHVTQTSGAITNCKAGGLLNLVKKIVLEFNDGVRGKRNVINVTGLGLLEYNNQVFNSLDAGTKTCLAHAIGGGYSTSGSKYRIVYRIPFAHPQIVVEPLRTRHYLPAHLSPEQPKLTIVSGAAADFGTQADPIAALTVEVAFSQRVIRPAQQAWLNSEAAKMGARLKDGYFACDLIETPYTLAASLSDSEQRFAIPMPGMYSGVLLRQLAYDATVGIKYADLSANTTPGSETFWGLEMAQQNLGKWRLPHLWLKNEYAKFKGTSVMTAHPDFGPSLASVTNYQAPTSVYIDRLSEGDGGEADEFSSFLDCNVPSNGGVRMDLVTRVSTPAGGTSLVSLVGHRYLDDVRPWQRGRFIA